MQKFLFALKLLEGEAAAVAEASDLSSYNELIKALKSVFKKGTSLIQIHNELSERKKKPDETMVEYMFKMKALGTDRMDENSMIEYIVDGLPADKARKTTLYEATSYDDLLENFQVERKSVVDI